jgi:hypothetical protein
MQHARRGKCTLKLNREDLKGRDHLGDILLEGRVIIKMNFKEIVCDDED